MTYPPSSIPDRNNGQTSDAAHLNALRDAVADVVAELGTNPSGAEATLTARLAAIDAAISGGGTGGGDPTPPATTLIGIMGLTETQYDYMKAQVAANANPWKAQYDFIVNWTGRTVATTARPTRYFYNTSGTYVPSAVATVDWLKNDASNLAASGCSDLLDDAIAARTQALLWAVTGTAQYKTNCIAILNAWRTTCTKISGKTKNPTVENAPDSSYGEDSRLYASWAVPHFVQAADIMRCKAGWDATEATAFGTWLKNVVWPRMDWATWGNWRAGFCEARVMIAAYRRNDSEMTFAVNHVEEHIRTSIAMPGETYSQRRMRMGYEPPWPWAGGYGPSGVVVPASFTDIPSAYRFVANANHDTYAGLAQAGTQGWGLSTKAEGDAIWNTPGLSGEHNRDLAHWATALGSWANACETAWHYGRPELWNNHKFRIARASELYCAWWREVLRDRVLNGRTTSYYTHGNAGYTFKPTGRYSLVDGDPDDSGTAYPHDRYWTWAGDWADESFEVVFTACKERFGIAMPNTEAVLKGWTESSVNYGNLRGTPGGSTAGPRGPRNGHGFESLTSAWVNTTPAVDTPPTAQFTFNLDGMTVAVDASTSVDGTNTITAWSWNWGDGTSAGSGETATHTYTTAGPHTITLTVTAGSLTDTESKTIPTVIAFDDFATNYTVGTARNWGTADIGGAWTAYPTSGSTTEAGVDTGDGVLKVNAHSLEIEEYLASVAAENFDITICASIDDMPTVGDARILLAGRHARSGASVTKAVYCELRFDMDVPKTQLNFSGSVGTSSNADVGSFTPPTDGQKFWFRFAAQGQINLQAKIWMDGSPEPASWTRVYQMTDGPTGTGGIMIRARAHQADYATVPLIVRVHDFWVHTPG